MKMDTPFIACVVFLYITAVTDASKQSLTMGDNQADVTNNDACQACIELMTLIDKIMSNQQVENYLATELSKICDLLVPGNEDLYAQCKDLFTEYFDSIWELIINKFMRAELVCNATGACP